jgi:hypothetical protein
MKTGKERADVMSWRVSAVESGGGDWGSSPVSSPHPALTAPVRLAARRSLLKRVTCIDASSSRCLRSLHVESRLQHDSRRLKLVPWTAG